jgi:Mrp family chromosome partitioning ATPase
MLVLHHRLDAMLPAVGARVVHFTAARHGEGTSTIVHAYGRVLAETLERSVLIIDANETGVRPPVYDGAPPPGWEDLAAGGEELRRAIHPTAHRNLSISPLAGSVTALGKVLDRAAVERVFPHLRERFDTILVDSSPALRPGAMAFSRCSDGVVLVVEADRTRWPVAVQARRNIEESGGRLVGIVLNRRRHHIPEPVYGWL